MIPRQIRIVVVLPAPFAPRKPKTSPRGDLEGQAVEGDGRAETLRDVVDLEAHHAEDSRRFRASHRRRGASGAPVAAADVRSSVRSQPDRRSTIRRSPSTPTGRPAASRSCWADGHETTLRHADPALAVPVRVLPRRGRDARLARQRADPDRRADPARRHRRWSAATRSPRPGATATTPATTRSRCCATAVPARTAAPDATAGVHRRRSRIATRSTHDRRHDAVPVRPSHHREQGDGLRARRPQPRARRQPDGQLRSLGGGEIHEYTSLLEDTRRQALDRLVANATLLGANAVVSMRFDSSELSGTMSEIVAYGTAVVVAPDGIRRPRRRRSNELWASGSAAPPRPGRRPDDGAGRPVPHRLRRRGRHDHRALHWSASASPSSIGDAHRAGPLSLRGGRPLRRAARAGRRRAAGRPRSSRDSGAATRSSSTRRRAGRCASGSIPANGERRYVAGGLTVGARAILAGRAARASATPTSEVPKPTRWPRSTLAHPLDPHARGPATPPSHGPHRRRPSRT